MVEVGIMMRKLQLLLAGSAVLMALACSTSSAVDPAELFKAEPAKPAENHAVLVGLEAESAPTPRLVLRTSQEPVYSSYAPKDGEFIVDLPGTTKSPQLTTPANLPARISSISADETVELGKPLTRVTMHYSGGTAPIAEAEGDTVVVSFDGTNATIASTTMPMTGVDPTPNTKSSTEPTEVAAATTSPAAPPQVASTPQVESPKPVEASEPAVEPTTTSAAVASVPVPDPVHRNVRRSLRPATVLQSVKKAGTGDGLTVSIETNGTAQYTTFRLEHPARIVIDLKGIRNEVPHNTIDVGDAALKRIRIGQFQSTPTPVARIVFDLSKPANYRVHESPDGLIVSFGDKGSKTAEANIEAARIATSQPEDKPAQPPQPVASHSSATSASMADRGTSGGPTSSVVPIADATHGEEAPAVPMVTPAASRATQVLRAPRPETAPQSTAASEPAASSKRTTTLSTGKINPGLSRTLSPGEKVYTGEPISLDMTNSDMKDVLRLFSELTGLNMAIDPNVKGSVTVHFDNVPWDQALDLILKQNGLTYSLQGNVMRIGTIDRLAAEQEKTRQLEEKERLNVPLSTVIKYLSYAKAQDVATLLKNIASPRGKIIVDTRTNQLIISEIPEKLQTMLNLIDTIDIPTPQVTIEARIVETTKNFAQQLGIAWGFTGAFDPALGTGTGLVFPNRVSFTGGPFNFDVGNPVLQMSLGNVLGTFDLDVLLTAAESEGLAKIISAPKITTQDNQAANIESGVQIPVQTRVNFTTTVTYVNATLRLEVTPQVTAEDTVIMQISVQKVEPALGLSVAGGSNSPLTTRRAQTKLMVRDGETAVIGGIYQATENSAQSRVPFLHNIPIIGNLFKNHDVNSRHDELLIFITPHIVRNS